MYQHRKTVEHHNKLSRGKRVTIEDLIVAKRTLSKELAEVYDKKGLQRNAQALLKFRNQVSKKLKRSAIVTATTSEAASAGHIDFAAPLEPKAKRSRSASNPGNDRNGMPENLVVMDADGNVTTRDPLEDAVKEHKGRGRPRTEKSGPVRKTAAVAAQAADIEPATETTIEDARAARRARLTKNGDTK
jgi:putative transposase